MAKAFVYTDNQTSKVIFESLEENHVDKKDVDLKVLKKTGLDPRLNPARISCDIRAVKDI